MHKAPNSALGGWEAVPEEELWQSPEVREVVSKEVMGLAFQTEETRHSGSESNEVHRGDYAVDLSSRAPAPPDS